MIDFFLFFLVFAVPSIMAFIVFFTIFNERHMETRQFLRSHREDIDLLYKRLDLMIDIVDNHNELRVLGNEISKVTNSQVSMLHEGLLLLRNGLLICNKDIQDIQDDLWMQNNENIKNPVS